MKELINDANFPRTADGRVYHLGLRHGEVANRILTVGDPTRARRIASHLDAHLPPFVLHSERGFLTITGLYRNVPVSIIAIGMGIANCDFLVRETRASVAGDICIIRLGSCGGLIDDLPIGSLVVPEACVAITRNYDYDFGQPTSQESSISDAYRISRPVFADDDLHRLLLQTLRSSSPVKQAIIQGDVFNATADSFYSSQGRDSGFPDHNQHLLEMLLQDVPKVATLEMESHHLYHLAALFPRQQKKLTDFPGYPQQATSSTHPGIMPGDNAAEGYRSSITAVSAQMVFAERKSGAFITPAAVVELEEWAGKACLDTLITFPLHTLHQTDGSIWASLSTKTTDVT